MKSARVVVTGIGAVTALGKGVEPLWQGVLAGTSGIRRIRSFDPSPFRSQIAAEVADFDPLEFLDLKRARRMERASQLAVAAACLAIQDSGLEMNREEADTFGVNIGSALGGISFAEQEHRAFLSRGIKSVSPYLALSVFSSASSANVAIEFGLRGSVTGNSNTCAAGTVAVGEAFHQIRDGSHRIVIAGGCEAPLSPLTFGAFDLIKTMSSRNREPEQACAPFNRGRDGFVIGEGAAILILENLDHARARGARSYAEVLGYGFTNDGYHMVTPRPGAEPASRAIRSALAQAGIRPEKVGYINAHGTSTPLGDRQEAQAIVQALGDYGREVPVSSTKGAYGHPFGASGAIEAALCALSIRRGQLCPSVNLSDPDPECPLNFLQNGPQLAQVDYVLSNSFGFGGFNAVLVLGRSPE